VEGVLFPPSAKQVQDKGKKPLHDEGPSGGQEADFILIQDDNTDLSSKLKDIIRSSKMTFIIFPSTWKEPNG